jgi:predicted amidohydrolase
MYNIDMKLGLVSAYSHNNDMHQNVKTIVKYLSENHHLDFLLFSEAFIQGFNALSWNYDIDINIAIPKDSNIFNPIKEASKKYNTSVGFGYYERDNKNIYCSYMIIDNHGNIINNYRRLSIGWKVVSKTNEYYREGTKLIPFTLNNYNFMTIICGDLWDDNIKSRVINTTLKNNIDIILWPNHLDYEIKQFNEEIDDYKERSTDIKVPLLLINDHSNSSHGGAVIFKDNHILKYLEMGNIGVLEFDINKK